MKGRSGDFDVLVAGAGPAGLSAAMWCRELGLSAVVLEQESAPGGQLRRIYNPITNYLGSAAANGAEMCDRFLQSVGQYNAPIVLNNGIAEIDVAGRSLLTRSGERYSGRFIIVATGVSRRRLGVPGEDKFEGKGVLASGARDRAAAAGKIAVVVGGGDAALENATMLSEFASRVYVIHRRSHFAARAEFVERAGSDPKIELICDSTVTGILGRDRVEAVMLMANSAAKPVRLQTDVVLIRIGVEPNTNLLNGKVELDGRGYVLVDPVCRTSAESVYAVGDAACPASPTIATAVGMGATAAKHIRFRFDPMNAV